MRKDHNQQSENLVMPLDFSKDFGALKEKPSFNPQPRGRFCTGLVLITHGFDAGFIGEPEWMGAMQNAIIKRLKSNARMGRIHVARPESKNDNELKLSIEWLKQKVSVNSAGSDCELFIRLDWTEIANYLVTGISTAMIADSLASYLCSPDSGLRELKELPLHFIGHSRGASIMCELAKILGKENILVEHVTTLDPHPLTLADPQPPGKKPVIDAPVTKYDNIRFMDNYWQQTSYPKGKPVKGAYNRCFSRLPGAYHHTIHAGFGDHMNVVMAYHATIDLDFPPSTISVVLKDNHRRTFFTPEEENGAKTGFYFSRTISPESRPAPNLS